MCVCVFKSIWPLIPLIFGHEDIHIYLATGVWCSPTTVSSLDDTNWKKYIMKRHKYPSNLLVLDTFEKRKKITLYRHFWPQGIFGQVSLILGQSWSPSHTFGFGILNSWFIHICHSHILILKLLPSFGFQEDLKPCHKVSWSSILWSKRRARGTWSVLTINLDYKTFARFGIWIFNSARVWQSLQCKQQPNTHSENWTNGTRITTRE